MVFSPSFPVKIAASFIRFARSAPENPTVAEAMLRKLTFLSNGLFLACTSKILMRSSMLGRFMVTFRSNRPGRNRALSKTSARLVAASIITLVLLSNPSISVRIWLRVCSRSSCPPPIPGERFFPMASISSINIIAGARSFASVNKSRTRAAPTPTNISTNSDPEMEKNGTLLSPATARASRVLPVPGGQTP